MPLKWLLNQHKVFEYNMYLMFEHPDPAVRVDQQWRTHLKIFSQLGYHLMIRAREVAKDGVSYRKNPFLVGAAGLFWKPAPPFVTAGYRIFTGANFKPFPGPKTKHCAERMALEWAEEEGYEYMVAMAIAGFSQDDAVSKLETPTLHCCHMCREMFEESPLVGPNSIIITVHQDQYLIEVRTVEDMLNLHNNQCGQ